jgi:hypothetical protein
VKIKKDYTKDTILCIPDLHVPYHHPDAFAFLEALKDMYEPTMVVNLGDLMDFHNISFHDSDPDLYGAGDELEEAREYVAELEEIFPEMYIIGSNHGDLPLRKFVASGMPRGLLRSYNEIYEVGEGWTFIPDLTIECKGRDIPDLYFAHGIRKNALQVAQQRGQRFSCGHFHESFELRYAGNPNSLIWAMMCGCLIDKRSLAFNYNKLNLNRPILGAAVIENGIPTLIPMLLAKDGRWIKEIL